MVRSLVAAEIGYAILNMLPLTSETSGGASAAARPISDTLPTLTLVLGYNRARPRRIVQEFALACRDHFTASVPTRCVISS